MYFLLVTNTKLPIVNIIGNYNVMLPLSLFQFMLIFIISGLVILGYCSQVCVTSGPSDSDFLKVFISTSLLLHLFLHHVL